jgi:hypothetical protein
MARGLSSMTIPASGWNTQAGSLTDGVSGCVWFWLGGKMGSFGIFWFGDTNSGGGLGREAGAWMGESVMPAPL